MMTTPTFSGWKGSLRYATGAITRSTLGTRASWLEKASSTWRVALHILGVGVEDVIVEHPKPLIERSFGAEVLCSRDSARQLDYNVGKEPVAPGPIGVAVALGAAEDNANIRTDNL